MPLTKHLGARVPLRLAEAAEQRASAAGVSISAVIAEGLVRAVTAPIDRRSPLYVAAWLARAEEQDTAAPAAEGDAQ